jgi:hypothetical protein
VLAALRVALDRRHRLPYVLVALRQSLHQLHLYCLLLALFTLFPMLLLSGFVVRRRGVDVFRLGFFEF